MSPGNLYVVPFQLGWHLARADVTTSFGLFAPTGRYSPAASDNVGRGMWSYELSGGATMYLDEQKTLSVAASGFWEIHSKKEGTRDVKVGQLMTIEGGFAKSVLHGAAHVGLAYFAQWKLTPDDLGIPISLPDDLRLPKHRVFGIGPDVTIPIATKSRLISLVNVRYLWETAAEMKTEGPSLLVTTTFPVPGVRISAGK